ncbi:DNA methyltransferase [Mycobacterium phage MooMoo]|uniref:Uncharacterized protein n=1 Tax=Mycobacterium phage MooMoo TaxID=2108127 RepID=A0A2P1JR97_9CAUD|nr:DNA methyltransferase [Mycobacterium phage MooMoo]AVO21678.1 hypothetical protein SEA_MOOMOO_73 [Mycobacterium phage MooMoo]
MSDRIETIIAGAVADGDEVTALDYDEARNVLAALKANRIALVEMPETQTDEYGEKYWMVPQDGERLSTNEHGVVRIDEWKSGPRITTVSIHTPIRPQNVAGYTGAMLAAAAEVSGE